MLAGCTAVGLWQRAVHPIPPSKSSSQALNSVCGPHHWLAARRGELAPATVHRCLYSEARCLKYDWYLQPLMSHTTSAQWRLEVVGRLGGGEVLADAVTRGGHERFVVSVGWSAGGGQVACRLGGNKNGKNRLRQHLKH
jgi:hypothetical protein